MSQKIEERREEKEERKFVLFVLCSLILSVKITILIILEFILKVFNESQRTDLRNFRQNRSTRNENENCFGSVTSIQPVIIRRIPQQ